MWKSKLAGYASFLLVFCGFSLLAVPSHARTLFVPDDYPSIQKALDSASDGDTVVVRPGVYREHDISFRGKRVVLKSSDGYDRTIIDGEQRGPVFVVDGGEGRETRIEGFTIRNGYGDHGQAGGIFVDGSSPTIMGNKIINNRGESSGGGIKVAYGGNPSIKNNIISGNTVFIDGGGIYMWHAAAEIEGNTIENNVARGHEKASGGGIDVNFCSNVVVRGNRIVGNQCDFAGGGLSVFASDIEIVGNVISGNDGGEYAGGIHLETQAQYGDNIFVVRSNTISENRATNKGGGIHVYTEDTWSPVEIVSNTIVDNICTDPRCQPGSFENCGLGGGIFNMDCRAPHKVEGNVIENNRADLYGGAAFARVDLVFKSNRVDSNHALFAYGGLFCFNNLKNEIVENIFSWNFVENPYPNVLNPGALYVKDGYDAAAIVNNIFVGNMGYHAGAICLNGESKSVNIDSNTFVDNESSYEGGGTVWLQCEAQFRNNIFKGDRYAVRIKAPGTATWDANDFWGQTRGLVYEPPVVYEAPTQLRTSLPAGVNYVQDPVLVVTDEGVRLAKGSPLVDRGLCSSQVARDFEGDSRPVGNRCDVGADEYNVGVYPVVGDWDGDGRDDVGWYVSGVFYMDEDGDGAAERQVAVDRQDAAPVIGDWNGDGISDVGLFVTEARSFLVDRDGNGVLDTTVTIGRSSDVPVVGDWDGDGTSDVGVFRPSGRRYYMDMDEDGIHERAVTIGRFDDVPLVGDWNGDGVDSIGVYRPLSARFYLDDDDDGYHDHGATFGCAGCIPLAGDWNGDGCTDVGYFSASTGTFHLDWNLDGAEDRWIVISVP